MSSFSIFMDQKIESIIKNRSEIRPKNLELLKQNYHLEIFAKMMMICCLMCREFSAISKKIQRDTLWTWQKVFLIQMWRAKRHLNFGGVRKIILLWLNHIEKTWFRIYVINKDDVADLVKRVLKNSKSYWIFLDPIG